MLLVVNPLSLFTKQQLVMILMDPLIYQQKFKLSLLQFLVTVGVQVLLLIVFQIKTER